MDAVRIGTADEYLQLASDSADGLLGDYVTAALHSGGTGNLTAAKRVYGGYSGGFADLVAYFADLETRWRGWHGERSWESLEHDLRLDARHAYGHVQVRVTLRAERASWGSDGWTATADLTVEPGEQLSTICRDLAGLAKAP